VDTTIKIESDTSTLPAKIEDGDMFSLEVNVETRNFGSIYPVVTWINGQPQNKGRGIAYTGGFFIDGQQELEIPGAEPYTHITGDGDEIEGTAIRDLTLIPVRHRRSWVVRQEGGLSQRFSQNEYEEAELVGAPRGACHLVARIPGVDSPVLLTFNGLSAKAMAAGGKNAGALMKFGQKVIMKARSLSESMGGKRIDYPTFAFSMVIGPQGDRSGKAFVPNHELVGKKGATSKISMPVWVDEPAKVDKTFLSRIFVGNALYGELEGLYQATEIWWNEWSSENLGAFRGRGTSAKVVVSEIVEGSAPDAQGMPF